jgi:TRAP-type C4-dicarboxylate transport system permease small subunit
MARLLVLYELSLRRLIALGFALMVLVTLTGTVFRYLPGLPAIYWAEEVTRYTSIWVVFLASGLAIERGAHLGVDIAVLALPGRLRTAAQLLALAFMLVLEAVLVVYGWQLALANMSQFSSALEIRMGWVFLAIPVGGALMIVATLRRMAAVVAEARAATGSAHSG